jgi:NAD(P)-dependent dehydrogenase (short-subunit alcohol dehydrogenase family)
VNLGGVLTGTQLALERFLPRGSGHIVNLASKAAMVASPYGATYSATKHAVLGFTRALRGELRGSGVLTTVVLPGVIRTDMTGEFKTALGVRTSSPKRSPTRSWRPCGTAPPRSTCPVRWPSRAALHDPAGEGRQPAVAAQRRRPRHALTPQSLRGLAPGRSQTCVAGRRGVP